MKPPAKKLRVKLEIYRLRLSKATYYSVKHIELPAGSSLPHSGRAVKTSGKNLLAIVAEMSHAQRSGMARQGEQLSGVRLWNLYGQTEIAPLVTGLGPDDQLMKPGSAGRPVLNVETRVVDDQLRDVKPGEIGEIVHRSPQLLLGYFRDEARTQAAFEGGWFHSGDLATIDDEGYITIVDRKKDMIKTGGENVSQSGGRRNNLSIAGSLRGSGHRRPPSLLDRGSCGDYRTERY